MNIQDDKQYAIYEKEINGKKFYRIKLSKKKQDGSYENGYIDIRFAKCTPPENKQRIYLKNAFWSFYLTQEKRTIPYVVCMEYETVGEAIEKSKDVVKQDTPDEFKDLGNSVTLEELEVDPELPF